MGEPSDYFEYLPEEDPAYYDENGLYDLVGQIHNIKNDERLKQKTAHQKLDEVLAKKGLLKKP